MTVLRADEDFVGLVSQACDEVWPGNELISASIDALVRELKAEICAGLTGDDGGGGGAAAAARKPLRDAGYSHVQATAALLECDGNGNEALKLLASGWALPAAEPIAVVDAPKCPLGFGKSSTAPVDRNPAPLVETLRERFNARAEAADASGGAGLHVAGRVLADPRQRTLDDLLDEPAEFCCPITLALLSDPALASDGVFYERAAIRIVIERGKLSPTTLEPLALELRGAPKARAKVLAFAAERAAALLRFADAQGAGLRRRDAELRSERHAASGDGKLCAGMRVAVAGALGQVAPDEKTIQFDDGRPRRFLVESVRRSPSRARRRRSSGVVPETFV